jgi:hypothetical protein
MVDKSDPAVLADCIKKLNRRRGGIKSQLTVFKDFVKDVQQSELTSLRIKELNLRLEGLRKLMADYDKIQIEIEDISPESEVQILERTQTESIFYSQIALAQDIIDTFSVKDSGDSDSFKSGSCHDKYSSIRLPTINLPTYDGNYTRWLEFKDLFESLINSNDSIAPVNKFHYLRNSLQGSASLVIRSIDFSASGYELAWKTLCERYDNKNILINNHLNAIVSVNPIQKESFKALRYLIDTVTKNLSSLDALGISTKGWDPLVIFLVSAKLDPKTNAKWEEYKGSFSRLSSSIENTGFSSDVPTLDHFKDFLRNRANVLETMYCSRSNENKNVHKENKYPKSFVTSVEAPRIKPCLVCGQSHHVYQCHKFKEMRLEDRLVEVSKNKLCNNCLRTGHNGSQCTLKGSCRSCRKKHNSLLHCDKVTSNNIVTSDIVDKINTSSNLSTGMAGQVLLCTAQVEVCCPNSNSTCFARALLDTGSQSSFVTQNLRKKLGLPSNKINSFKISGINNKETEITERVQIRVKSRVSSFSLSADCLVIPIITGNLPNVEIDIERLDLPRDVELADPQFYKPSQIDILLGADKFFEIINSKQIKLGKDKPILQDSKLGWIVAGLTGQSYYQNNINCHLATTRHRTSLQDVDDSLKRFWEVEDLPSDCKSLSVDEEFCETHYVENTSRLPNGRFSVMMPFKEKPEESLGNSYPIAMRRFLSLEKKLNKSSNLKDQYRDFLEEYAELGHMTEVERPGSGCYLPHHCIVREQKETTKLRVVFDCSAQTSSGKSLNDIQAIGPVVQSDLLSILLRFRANRYVLTADIEKMYRQIALNQQQRYLHLILWRDQVDKPIKIFQLNTLTYGTASAPFLSTRCLKQLALECQDEIASNVIEKDFYIDDLITGSSTVEELKHIYTKVVKVLDSACFPLRKFRTNCPQILESQSESTNCLDLNNEASVLGLKWFPQSDQLHFPIDFKPSNQTTKRIIISTTCKLFDPLGLLCCCIVKAKILLQNLWSAKLGWDDPVPPVYEKRWLKFINNLYHLSHIYLDRHVFCDMPNVERTELHCFVDASQEAYGACVYLRSVDHNNYITVRLLCAKARVAPIKKLTIPRLELCASLLGAQLCTKVTQSIKTNISKYVIWTDSTVVLGWLKSQTKTLQTFVRNRVNKINELTQGYEWFHVPTNLNPADLASRGVEPQHLQSLSAWWEGPSFLKKDPREWPVQPHTSLSNLPEIKVLLTITDDASSICDPIISFDRYSSYIRLKRIYAYVFRFIHNSREPNAKLTGPLLAEELKDSLAFLVKKCQSQSFNKDIQNLSEGRPLHHRSRLLSLNPFVDPSGVLRVGGRIGNSNYHYNKKHPLLLDAKHHFTKLLMNYEHLRLYHAGSQLILSSLREEFWPIGGRNLARNITKKCVNCVRLRGKTVQPIMGDLPNVRVATSTPFHFTGIDFAGPFMIANKKGRGSRNTKAYLCVFVCLTTKAIHLEVVSDLTTEAFILCLRRFVSRRGKPEVIYCDNGRNFVGAHNELGRVLRSSRHPVSDYATNEAIHFKFIPAYAPNFGGIWEAGVRAAKFHLKRIAGNANLTFEELATLFVQIEAILNSRPITPLSSDPNDMCPLTPGHFLITRPLTSSVPSLPVTGNPTTRYKRIEQIRQQFWDRWRREFMAELQQRVKWKNKQRGIQVGDLVLLKEDNLMPLQWRRGRVVRLYPGPDDVCRVADIMTEKGPIKRAVNKMCLLPITDPEPNNDANKSSDDQGNPQ